MVKKCLVLLAVFLILAFSGCSDSSDASAGRIIPPPLEVQPFTGKWEVLQALDANGTHETTGPQQTDGDVQFAEDSIALGGKIWDDLSYKIKRVNARNYLATKYISVSDFSIQKSQTVDVVTVYAASNYLGEFMKLDAESMIFFTQNNELILKKVSDQADSRLGSSKADTQNPDQERSEGASGVLLGLKIPSDKGCLYQTIWIAEDHRKLHPVLEAENLFFPRTSGFWELSVRDSAAGAATGNTLIARNVAVKTPDGPIAGKEPVGQKDTGQGISVVDYIGNDYVAIERNIAGINRLQVLPVDKMSSSAEIKVADLLGSMGVNAYQSAWKQMAAELKTEGAAMIGSDGFGDNFGLARKNGHWILVGRINYEKGGTIAQKDFELKSIPPNDLIFYDTLGLSWHKIKDRVPDAMDAFTSPGKDIALVRTKNKLTVYNIGIEQLDEDSLAELDLPEDTAVIMAEWATGFVRRQLGAVVSCLRGRGFVRLYRPD